MPMREPSSVQAEERVLHDVLRRGAVAGEQEREPHQPERVLNGCTRASCTDGTGKRTGRGEGRLLSAQQTQDWLAERQWLAAHRHDGRAEVAVVPQGCEHQHEHRARVLDARG